MSADERAFGLTSATLQGIQGLAAVFGIIGGLFAAGFALHELQTQGDMRRAEATLDLVQAWEDGGYLDDFRTLDRRVSEILDRLPSAEIDAARANGLIADRLYERVAQEVLVQPGSQEAYEDLTYFFQRVHICVTVELCHRSATAGFYDGPMESFSRVFWSEIKRQRERQPDFAGWVRN